MADQQIEEVIAQIMSLSDYDEQKFYLTQSSKTDITVSSISEESNSSAILKDSQDNDEQDDDE